MSRTPQNRQDVRPPIRDLDAGVLGTAASDETVRVADGFLAKLLRDPVLSPKDLSHFLWLGHLAIWPKSRTPSEHPNPTTKTGSRMGGTYPKMVRLVLAHSHFSGKEKVWTLQESHTCCACLDGLRSLNFELRPTTSTSEQSSYISR